MLATSYAPYGLLMPHVRAVVHQCGIGTLSHTLRAGVPSVACPFAFDQPNNARRLEELGVAELVLPTGTTQSQSATRWRNCSRATRQRVRAPSANSSAPKTAWPAPAISWRRRCGTSRR